MMKMVIATLAALLVLTACQKESPPQATAPAAAPQPAEAPVAAPAAEDPAAALREALTQSSRADEEKARDAGRKPADVVTFLGFGPGMTVMDVIAAGGFYTEVLSIAVGENGKVYAQNPPFVLQFRDGMNDKAMTARLADNRLPNVVRMDADLPEVAIEAGSLDGAITALNLHDVYNRDPEAAVGMLKLVYGMLKPGGVFGVIDHAGVAGADNASLHRMEKAQAIEAATAAGFEIAGDSDLLSNADDDHTKMVFEEPVRGRTDRFLLKLRRPE
ncbi:MAG: class I SAM-dependent methyltransferase [Pseudomonadales bacterium]|nr:class I SAM-dependent methyltransferase [Pseudomonadales bacterium]